MKESPSTISLVPCEFLNHSVQHEPQIPFIHYFPPPPTLPGQQHSRLITLHCESSRIPHPSQCQISYVTTTTSLYPASPTILFAFINVKDNCFTWYYERCEICIIFGKDAMSRLGSGHFRVLEGGSHKILLYKILSYLPIN